MLQREDNGGEEEKTGMNKRERGRRDKSGERKKRGSWRDRGGGDG